MLTPDIYQPNFAAWCKQYSRRGNPLFIPEMHRDEGGARNVFYAIGQHDAIGTSPFAVDSLEHPEQTPLSKSYAVLQQLAPVILAHQGTGATIGFLLDSEHPAVTYQLGGYELEISLDEIFGYKADIGYGLLVAAGQNTFIGAGSGFRVAFRAATPGSALVGIGAVDEGGYRDGQWIARRRLNGDENDQGRCWRFSNQGIAIERCTVYRCTLQFAYAARREGAPRPGALPLGTPITAACLRGAGALRGRRQGAAPARIHNQRAAMRKLSFACVARESGWVTCSRQDLRRLSYGTIPSAHQVSRPLRRSMDVERLQWNGPRKSLWLARSPSR